MAPTTISVRKNVSKYEQIYEEVRAQILTSSFREGDLLPTEAQFMKRYLVSRPTVARALRMLEDEGLVSRTPGLGTTVRAGKTSARARLLGLAFPELGHGEIFDPIGSRVSDLGKSGNYSLLWGTTKAHSEVYTVKELLELFEEFIARNADGVFFAPLEGRDDPQVANRKALDRLWRSGIPVVLIDRDYCRFPERSEFPLVGIDNFRSGYLVASHFLNQQVERVDFLWYPYHAYTVDIRIRGYSLALIDAKIPFHSDWVHHGYPEDPKFLKAVLDSGARNLIFGNDEMAALAMNTLRDMGVDIPAEVRVAAFDDVKYGRLISVPLTTVHQPIEEIARVAVENMQWNIDHSGERRSSTTFLPGSLVVRQSSMVHGRTNGEKKE